MLQGAITDNPCGRASDAGAGRCVTCGSHLGAVGPGGFVAALEDDDVLARVCSEACYHGYWAVVFRRYQASVGV